MVNVFSRHIGVLCLIRPWDHSGKVPREVQRFYDLLNSHAFWAACTNYKLEQLGF
jgi:hypothetical protein